MKIRGRRIFYLPKKGFGFVRSESGEKFFCHYSEFQTGVTAQVNLSVEFDRGEPVSDTGKNGIAINIIVVEQALDAEQQTSADLALAMLSGKGAQ